MRIPKGLVALGILFLGGCASVSDYNRLQIERPVVAHDTIWIDSDPAHANGVSADPDDVMTIAMLREETRSIVGVSTTRGNVSEATAWESAKVLRDLGWVSTPLHRGTAALGCKNPAVAGLARALEYQTLTILALGALDNIAGLIECHPNLTGNINRIIAVMGRRPHEEFELGAFALIPRELADLNFETNPAATAIVLASGVPLSVVPFQAGNQVRLTYADIPDKWPQLKQSVMDWGSTLWLVGGGGSIPAFDPVAAALVLWPELFDCEATSLSITHTKKRIELQATKTVQLTKNNWCVPNDRGALASAIRWKLKN